MGQRLRGIFLLGWMLGDAMPLHDYSDTDLVRRAVRNARSAEPGPVPRWVAVKDTFGLGSTYARDLCRLYDCDPDEISPFETGGEVT